MRLRRWPTAGTLALLALAVLSALRLAVFDSVAPPPLPETDRLWRVVRVIDGDTLLLEGQHRVRLIGVDTPETKRPGYPVEPFGPEASEFTRERVEGRDVRLVYDRHRRDDYQRVLAFVYFDDQCLNEELIRAGLSRAETYFPFRSDLQRRFRAAEQEARAAHRGIWSVPEPR